MIFRSGSLIANMLLGIFFLRKRYNLKEFTAVVLVTVGIIMSTYASKSGTTVSHSTDIPFEITTLFIGIILLAITLFSSAGLGVLQEWTYSKIW